MEGLASSPVQATHYNVGFPEGFMLSRRHLLRLGGVAAATIASRCLTVAEEATKPALPTSIENLKSLREQAKPITTEERAARQEKARALM